MSGILLPGQENQPQPDSGGQEESSSGIVLPKGYGSHRQDPPADAPKTSETEAPQSAEPDASAAESAPAAAPDAGQSAGRPQMDFRFPPSGAQIQCPNCGTPYTAAVFTIIDLGENPELKGALLSGQINVGVCPSCNTAVQLGAPLLVHEPEHEFLGVYVPPSNSANDLENQKVIGDLTQTLMRTIPSEARRGYMLQPRQFFDWNNLVEKLWEFEGVTPEMLRRRNEQSALVQRLLTLADDPKALELALERSKHLVDREFFGMLEQLAMAMRSQGQPQATQQLLNLRDKLLDTTDAGRELRRQQEKAQSILQQVTQQTTPGELLDILLKARSEPDGEDLSQILIMALAPLINYPVLMELSQRIEQASDVEERSDLMQLRERLLEIQEEQQASQQAMMQQVQTILQEVLQADDMDAKLREYAEYIDETFLGLIAANIQSAQQQNATAAAHRFQQVYEKALGILQESMPDELRLLQQLVGAADPAEARKLLQENRSMLTPEFVETMQAVEEQFRSSGRTEAADRLKTLRGQVSLML